jgi:hypothetical protein
VSTKLPRFDPHTGLEIIDEHVVKHEILENKDDKPKSFFNPKTSKYNKNLTDVQLFMPSAKGNQLNFLDVSLDNDKHETFLYKKNEDIIYRNKQKNKRNSFYIFPCWSRDNTTTKRKTWDMSPDFIYNKKGIKNRELTFYFKVGKPLESLRRVAVRLGGAWNVSPSKRSFIEIGYPTPDYPDVYFCAAYAAGKNVLVSTVNQYFSGDRVVPDKWIGLKIVSQVASNKSHVWYGIYVDLDSYIADNGRLIPSNNWKLKSDITFVGVKEYDRIIPVWRCEYDSIIIEGYEDIEFRNISDKEVDFMGLKPLHHDLSVITDPNSNLQIYLKKAMIPIHLNLNDYELEEDMIKVEHEEFSNINHKPAINFPKLTLPRANRDNDPTDPSFYGKYTH